MNKKLVPVGSEDESWFIENMKRFRERLSWSQGELARRVSDLGWDGFHQTTISRIEKGERPVRLAEARGIAAALDVSVIEMTSPPTGHASLIYALRNSEDALAGASAELHKAAEKYEEYRSYAKTVLEATKAQASSGPIVESLKETLENEIRSLSFVLEMDAVQFLGWIEDRKYDEEMKFHNGHS